MSGVELIDELLGPLVRGDTEEESALLNRYCARLVELNREGSNEYMADRRDAILDRLPDPRSRAAFVLGNWLSANRSEWPCWAGLLSLEGFTDDEVDALAVAVVAEILEDSAGGSGTSEIDSLAELIEPLRPVLGRSRTSDQTDRLREAAEEATGKDWTEDEEGLARQTARHRLVRVLETATPDASEELAEVRAADVLWPIHQERVISGLVLQGWRELAVDLPESAYEEIFEAIPGPDKENEPVVYAEAVAARAAIRSRGPLPRGPAVVKGHLDELKVLHEMGNDYRLQKRSAALCCIDLGPRSNQLIWLLWYAGSNPGEEAIESVLRWSKAAGRGPTATLITKLMPLQVAEDWMPVLSGSDYEETPVLKAVETVLLKDRNEVEQREKMANSLELLGLRTKGGPQKVAKMVVDLLNPRRKKHHRVNLGVALTLCRTLGGTEHGKAASIEKQLIAYSKKWNHYKFNEDQYRSILIAGVTLPEEYLSKKTRRGLAGVLDEVAGMAEDMANKASEVVSSVTDRLR